MVKIKSALLVSALFLTACSSGGMNLRSSALNHLTQLQFAEAEKDLTDPKILRDKKNRLLTLLELGTVAHYQGLFEKSNIYLFKAKEVYRELYTSSVREALATGLINDNAASYVGMDYEISMLHYYITSNFLALNGSSQLPAWQEPALVVNDEIIFPEIKGSARTLSDNDRVDFLGKARAELLDWNSFLAEVRERNRGEPYYKDDLLNKVFAAYTHRLVGSNQDRNIADNLYRDAREVLLKANCAYPTFNSGWQSFIENYDKFPGLGMAVVRERFVQATPALAQTEAQIDLAAKKGTNFMLIVESAEIPKRIEHRYVIGLSTLFGQIQDPALRRQVEELGMQAVLQMAPAFGLTVMAATVVGATTGSDANGGNLHYLSEAVDSAIGFEFKLPHIEDYPPVDTVELWLKPVNGGAPIQIVVAPLTPLGDIARLNVDRRAASMAFKTGVRVGMKYLAALIPAMVLYKNMEGKPDFLRMIAASAVWMGGKKIADASEAADLRAWNFLPRWIGAAEAKVEPGVYSASLVSKSATGNQETKLGNVTISGGNAQQFWRARVFSTGKVVLQ